MTITIVVEDGTGLPNADVYVSQADADAYFAKRNNAVWAAAAADAKAAALVAATSYLDRRYKFKGYKVSTAQALEWPRTPAVANAVDPAQNAFDPFWGTYSFYAPDPNELAKFKWPVKRITDACCELALRALTTDLYTDESPDRVMQKTVGPITKRYFQFDKNGGQTRYAVVDDLVSPFLNGGGRMNIAMGRS
ncbi:DnaT-like ssDNA-binding protein [Burkholderia ubonensis]|uniref:Putative DnaT-like domain-containing protein n=1 Tax=Burkholderia ubonensis TaxID=101571 RepID=A0ABD4E9S8_9BURK|nr:DnaT-like ssDNA-binding protein [Burkholderia ubonensis]KVN92541.1 hypothetical protein WJ68_33500 [Burkholderia ubonensis]KVT92703.1 hypothetical protein WK60_14025 [Burkholderia ubonensis]KVZ57515.1 hypothetical protein WL19_03360 [Burkholderia ubonensis]